MQPNNNKPKGMIGLVLIAGAVGWLIGHHQPPTPAKAEGAPTAILSTEHKKTPAKAGCDCGGHGLCPCADCRCPTVVKKSTPVSIQAQAYRFAREAAARAGKALVVGVGCDVPEDAAYDSVRWDGFPGEKAAPFLVISIPAAGDLWWASTMGPEQNAEEVAAEVQVARKAIAKTVPAKTFPAKQSQPSQANCANGSCAAFGFGPTVEAAPQGMASCAGGSCSSGGWGFGRLGGRRR